MAQSPHLHRGPLAEKAREVFQKVADGGGGNLNFFLSLVGVAISAAGIFASGGTAIALGALGTANGLATLRRPRPRRPSRELAARWRQRPRRLLQAPGRRQRFRFGAAAGGAGPVPRDPGGESQRQRPHRLLRLRHAVGLPGGEPPRRALRRGGERPAGEGRPGRGRGQAGGHLLVADLDRRSTLHDRPRHVGTRRDARPPRTSASTRSGTTCCHARQPHPPVVQGHGRGRRADGARRPRLPADRRPDRRGARPCSCRS